MAKKTNIEELIPRFKPGYIFYDGFWGFSEAEPTYCEKCQQWEGVYSTCLDEMFDLEPFKGDPRNSLRRINE